jgi:ribosomal protein S18 acetylase RimI-like enzyme
MEVVALSRFKSEALRDLFQEEKEEWSKNLRWDYSQPLQIISRLMNSFNLSGFVALRQGIPAGYAFYLEEGRNGVIGNCFVARAFARLGVEEALLDATVEALKANRNIDRIESQFISFRSWPYEAFFHRHQFSLYERYFMSRDCSRLVAVSPNSDIGLRPWNLANMEAASQLTLLAYDDIVDREISFHYQSLQGCRSFLTGIVEKPGCGNFLQDASFCAWHRQSEEMIGFVLTSAVSPFNGHISQVLVSKTFQGKGIGGRLLNRAITALRAKQYETISLSATAQNEPACELYRRFQFEVLIRFQASVWKRQPEHGQKARSF